MRSGEAEAGVFVTSRGSAWKTGLSAGLGGVVGAAAGAAAGRKDSGTSPLAAGDLAYLAVLPGTVAVFKAKRGALKPKATDEVLGSAERSTLRGARYRKGVAVGVFELEFTDGSGWAFDVGRAFAKDAKRVAALLGAQVG